MKRILYSYLFLVTLFISTQVNAQAFNFAFTPNVICFNPIPNSNVGQAAITATNPGAQSYTFVIVSPPGCNATQTVSAPLGFTTTITYPCCGIYTVTAFAYNGPAPINNTQHTVQVVCPTGATIIPSPTVVCLGNSSTVTATGAVNYTWAMQPINSATPTIIFNTNSIVATPSVNTSFTVLGITAAGCSVTATSSISVQSASVNAGPASQTLCPGAQVCFTSTAGAINNASVSLGTAISGYQWLPPTGGPPITAGPNKCTPATFGIYTVVATHTGAAGSCSITATTQVFTISTIPITVSPTSPSVCPGAPITLSATSSQTASASYTWTSPTFPTTTVNKNLTVSPLVPSNYTVNVTYFGCTGTATVDVGIRQLTVTLTSSAPNTCPNKSLTLTSSGGTTYTFTAYPSVGFPTSFTLTKPTANTATHAPTSAQMTPFGITYVVTSFSSGCVGSNTITVNILTISPTLTSSSYSVCAGTNFTLSTTGGAGTTYTYNTPIPTTVNTGSVRTLVSSLSNTILPIGGTYTVQVDSAGCKGTSNVTINEFALNTALTASSNSVCPNTAYSFSATGGAGTNYTFTPPAGSTPPLLTVVGNVASHSVPNPTNFPITYTVVADSIGCRSIKTITIGKLTLNPLFTASSKSICTCTQFTMTGFGGAGTSYSFTAPYGNISNVPITNNIIEHTPPCTTTIFPITYTLNVDSAGCKGTSTMSIGILGMSNNLSLTASSASACVGTQFTLNATGAGANTTYSFYALAGSPTPSLINASTTNTLSYTFTNQPATYTVSTDSAGCVGSTTFTLYEKVLTGLNLSPVPSLICAGMPTTLTAAGVGLGTMTNFTFATISPTSLPIFAGNTHTLVYNPTVTTVYAVIADSAGCKSPIFPATATVTMKPGLTLTTSVSSSSICPGLTTTLSVGGGSASSTYSYSWYASTNSVVPIPGDSTAITNPTTTTTYTVSGIDPFGCVGSATAAIGIDPFATLPILVSSSETTLCPGLTTTLAATSTVSTLGGLSTITYTWKPVTNVYLPSAVNPSVTTTQSVSTTYTVIGSNPYGCVGSNTVFVTSSSFPILSTPASAAAVCTGFTSTITAFGANSYTWTGNTFSNSIAQQSISVGPGTFVVTGSNGGGCISTATTIIYSATPLTITIGQSSQTTCIANNSPKYSKPISLTASGASSYVWFPYNPNNMTYSLGPSTTVRPPSTTQYTITGSTSICSGQTVITVQVIPQFTMNVIPPLPAMCLGDSLKLSIVNIHTLAVGPVSAFTYSWTEAANAPPISISNNLTPTVMVFPQNTTTYSVEVFDSRQCVSLPRLVTVTVLPKPITAIAIPTINSVATNTVCFVGLNPGAQDVTINLTASNMNTGLQFGVVPTYTWVSPYPSKYPSILTPVNNNAVTVNAPIKLLNNSSIAVYTLVSGYNGVPGCKRYDTVSVHVVDCRPVRDVKFTTAEKNDTICARNCITFLNLTDTMAGGPQTYTWNFQGGSPSTSTLQIPTVCYNLPGKYNVILKVKNPYPVSDGGSERVVGELNYIKVVDVPNVTIFSPGQQRSDTTIRFGELVNFNGSGALTYGWFPAYNISSLTNPSVTVKPFKTTQYILTGYNSKSCYSSDTVNVIIIEDCGEMYVPNAFTPNNDGTNDVLYVRGICLQSMTFMIFNRWGEKVFETADQAVGWDGNYKGELMNTGVFVYRLEGKTYNGKSFSLKGNITLIR